MADTGTETEEAVPAPAGGDVPDDQKIRLDTILEWLSTGKITTEQAAQRVTTLHFSQPPRPSVGKRMAEDAHGDIPMPDPGSFRAVSQAYAAGKITRSQYDALAEAAHAAMRSDGIA
jgi:hypothetical protein